MSKYRLSEEQRAFSYQDNGNKKSVLLRQIIALADFNDVKKGDVGGWIDNESALAHDGHCWIYDMNTVVFAGVKISGHARITGACLIQDNVEICGNAWISSSVIGHGPRISDNVTIENSCVRGECRLFGNARILDQSEIVAARGLTQERDLRLQIYDRATVTRSRIVHQAQIYGDAVIRHAFIEHRAEVFDFAQIEGNEVNDVWLCDCAKVYGHARVIAGREEDAIPTLRYSSQVAEYATVEGNCVLKHHVRIGGNALVRGGPVLLDDRILIQGDARILGAVVIENNIEMTDHAAIEAAVGDVIYLRGPKVINGEEYITRTPLIGSL